MSINILALGDVFGKPGRHIIRECLQDFKRRHNVAFCVANGENAAGGTGLTPVTAKELLAAGVDVLTNGDHVWRRKEIAALMERDDRLLRPANLSPLGAGRGYHTYHTPEGVRISVINLLGRTFMMPSDSPFRAADDAITRLTGAANIILVDIHAEATSEKIAMGWYLDGRVSLVFGTHTHVQTADARVLPKGTGYITDLGMTGPYDSVIGARKGRVLKAFLTQMPFTFDVAKGDVRMCGVLVKIDEETGRAEQIKNFRYSRDTK